MKTEQNQNFQTAWAELVLLERMKPESVAEELELTMRMAETEEPEQVEHFEAMETVFDQVEEFEQVEPLVQELPEVSPDWLNWLAL